MGRSLCDVKYWNEDGGDVTDCGSKMAAALTDWDGRQRAVPETVCREFGDHPDFVPTLVGLCRDPACSDGATWCLKWWAKRGGQIAEFAVVVQAAIHAPGWASRLHVLQMLPEQKSAVVQHDLAQLVDLAVLDRKPMVRAWGYFGADIMAQRFPDCASGVSALLTKARRSETAGSVVARLKRCRL